MAQEGKKMTIEEIKAQFLEIPTERGPNTESEELARKILENNYKLCLLVEHGEQKATETKIKSENDPKIELLKNKKIHMELLKKFHKKIQAENSELADELTELKMKLKEKRFFDKQRKSYAEYREKIFPMLMRDCDKKEELIDELNKNDCGNFSEKDFKKVTRELEKVTKENERLKRTEENIIEIRRKNEVIEVETCRIQVRNIEMENEIRLFDEFVLENQIAALQENIKNAKEAKATREEEKNTDEFKNPNDFPALLDFLDKSKKLKQKKKRKLTSPSRPPSKRRKNKTGSYSQHDKNGKQVKSPTQKNQMGSRGSKKNPEAEKALVMESYGLKMKTAVGNNSLNLRAKESNEQGNMLQRQFASTNLAKSSHRPPLQRQNSIMQMQPNTSTAGMSPRVQHKGQKQLKPINNTRPQPKRYEPPMEYETDEDGHLLLQRFPSMPLVRDEPDEPPKKVDKAPSKIPTRIGFVKKPTKVVETPPNYGLERMETDMALKDASVTKQPSIERGLRPRKNLKSPKLSPKKAGSCDKKENNRKKVKSPKKEIKKSQGKKKVDKSSESGMIVDENIYSSADDNSTQIKMVIDDNNTPTSVDNADKSMAVDENPPTECSVNSNSNNGASNESSIAESNVNNVMDVDPNVQNQGSDSNLPEISPNADEVNMEQESPGNDKEVSNIEIFDVDMENVDQYNIGDEVPVEMSDSFERLFCSSPTSSGNLEFNQSFDINFDNSRELGGNDSGGKNDSNDFFNFDNGNDDKSGDDFFNFDTKNDGNDDFFGNNSFKSNEGKADDFF